MQRDYIVKTVNETLGEEFELEPEQMIPEAHLRDDLHLDSLDIVDMIMALEQAFSFKLEDRSKILEIATLRDVYDFIEKIYKNNRNEPDSPISSGRPDSPDKTDATGKRDE